MQQQSILALGALLILITVSLNQQRSTYLVHQSAYLREMESAASDLAKLRIHQITEGFAYDEARVGMSVLDTAVGDLTPPASLGPDAGEGPVSFDDIDDFNGHVDTLTHTLSNETYLFEATYTVRYVDPVTADTTSLTRALAKQVIADVVSLDKVGHSAARVSFKKTVAITDFDN